MIIISYEVPSTEQYIALFYYYIHKHIHNPMIIIIILACNVCI